ncbi:MULTISPECIES: MliC family protein [Thiorhodovibrio]|uniref:MliC family protein n=1 Tax=Thiorhodovibrio TaxID=61593 RepID=UPI0019125F90|nr:MULTISPECIES: MliC family protein [Thiorhodovibrio]WPL12458.1 Membrane-bound lysozyme-inhibitor of c-type lysozyme [Thiorhodovibrio litoralis]
MSAKCSNTALLGLIPVAMLLIATPVSADQSAGESADKSEAGTASHGNTRIKWQCTEQSATRVVVNAQGTLASETQPAKTTQPIQIHAIKLDPTASGPRIPARLISTDSDLAAPSATWSPGNSVTASDGRLRLDLTDNKVFLASAQFGNQAVFRRFDCDTAGKNAPIHYQCGPEFDLWVDFVKAPDNASDTADSASDSAAESSSKSKSDSAQVRAVIHYRGGKMTLSQSRSGSGARYADGDSSLLIKGDSATFTPDGDEAHSCQVDD